MSDKEFLLVGRLFGAAIMLWGLITLTFFLMAVLFQSPVLAVCGVVGVLGTSGLIGIATIIHKSR